MDLICPKCQGQMRQYERNGVTVDQCTECRGLFLDRGELEHLINAEQGWYGPGDHQRPHDERGRHDTRRYDERRHPDHGQRRKRRSFLEDLFD
jgi:Zn-finger nucleic acid-binding protein